MNSGGLLSSADLASAGVTRDGVASLAGRELTRITPGLFVLGSEPTWRQYADAALQIAGDGAFLFRRTALALHGLGEEVLPIEVLTATHDQPRSRSWVRFARSDLRSRVLEERERPRVGLDDTLIDVSDKTDELETIALLTRALQERRTTVARVRSVIDQRRRVRHRALIEHVLDDAAGVESVLERLYIDNVETPHGIEPMTRQFVVPSSGHRSDGAYLERGALVELDGSAYHDDKADRILDNRHAALGWSTLRFGWADCWVTPCATARIVSGGAPPKTCRRCRRDD